MKKRLSFCNEAAGSCKSGGGLHALQNLSELPAYPLFGKRLGVRAVLCRSSERHLGVLLAGALIGNMTLMTLMGSDLPATNHSFRAGAAASNITPQIGSSLMGLFNERHSATIHDELHARCLVLDNGEARLAIVVCDNCMIPRDI